MARASQSAEGDASRFVTSLDMQVTTGGENFSQGERQLVSPVEQLILRRPG